MMALATMKKFHKLLLLVTCVSICWISSASAKIMLSIEGESLAQINTATVDIIEACYNHQKTIVVHADSDRSSIQSLAKMQSVAMILYNDATIANAVIRHREKMQLFLTTANSAEQLDKRLGTFRHSPWWNIMATFFILDESNCGCANSEDSLKQAWKMNILTAFFVCLNDRQRVMIYSYNPYTNRAPVQWKRVKGTKTVKQSDGWTMYRRRYRKGNICDGLNFDRTKVLDGTKIKIVNGGTPIGVDVEYNGTAMKGIFNYQMSLFNAMIYALNVRIMLRFSPNYKKLLQNGESDMTSITEFLPDASAPMYPLLNLRFRAVTHQGYYTPVENIWNYYGHVTLLSMIVILSITYVVVLLIMWRTPRNFEFAGFELLRLLIHSAIKSPMNGRASKIFFMMIFWYFLIIHATFDGHISSWLTKKVPRENVDSLDDLKDEKFVTIYVGLAVPDIIVDPILREKAVEWRESEIPPEIFENDSVAFIAFEPILTYQSIGRDDVYLMKNAFGNIYLVLQTRLDWPLKDRVDYFLMRLGESGIQNYISELEFQPFFDAERRQTAQPEVYIRKLSMPMITFMWYIWAFGLACSIICFIIEMRIGRRRSVGPVLIRIREVDEGSEIHRSHLEPDDLEICNFSERSTTDDLVDADASCNTPAEDHADVAITQLENTSTDEPDVLSMAIEDVGMPSCSHQKILNHVVVEVELHRDASASTASVDDDNISQLEIEDLD